MTKSCKNDGVSGGIRPPRHSRESGNLKSNAAKIYLETTETALPSFPCRRESRPSGNGNIQKPCENLKGLDSRFHGNDEELRE
ncbi:hypothetical protein E0W36_09220 [Neisseria meningitidis]|nr:hypothetical protein [Neisseria meningitidis]